VDAATLRLTMALLTHPRFPFPIWRLMQVRNLVVQHRACLGAERLDLEASVVWWRAVAKGMEMEILARIFAEEEPVMESTTTFFTRGDFGTAGAETAPTAPELPAGVASSWSIPRRGVGPFGRLTGDYNPVHWSGLYARALGFRSASAHPHRALAQLIDRLPGVELRGPLRIEAWFKGPIEYGRSLELSSERHGPETVFALRLQGDARPALVGRLGTPGSIRAAG
jgi:acyl dehydratase